MKRENDYAIRITGGSACIKSIVAHIKDCSSSEHEVFHVIRKSANTCWLSTRTCVELGRELQVATLEIRNEESCLLNDFKKQYIAHSSEIRNVSQALDYLDVLTSFAKLSLEKDLICPKVDSSEELNIVGGRHLVVEEGLQTKLLSPFTSNDCNIRPGNLWIVTGPNMGGKSTFLRQNAIIVILAQIGCFVPCQSAHIGIVDKIFSRVGSADDLYNDMSTFMVEMIETSFIMKGATKRSLAILDEIGRGTGIQESIGIAFATLNYLICYNKCRTLFATHFGHQLCELIKKKFPSHMQEKVQFYKSDVVEGRGKKYYDHKMKKGICEKSDAIRVAYLSGFPEEAIATAKDVLEEI